MYMSPLLIRPRKPDDIEIGSFIRYARNENVYSSDKYIMELAGLDKVRVPKLKLTYLREILPAFSKLFYISIPNLYNSTLHRFASLFYPKTSLGSYKGLYCFNLQDYHQREFCRAFFRINDNQLVCPYCVADNGYNFIFWNLKIIPACPIHSCFLIFPKDDFQDGVVGINEDEKQALNLFLFFLGAKKIEGFPVEDFAEIPWLENLAPEQFFKLVRWIFHFNNNYSEKWEEWPEDQMQSLQYLLYIFQILRSWPKSIDGLIEEYIEGKLIAPGDGKLKIFHILGTKYREMIKLHDDYPDIAEILISKLRSFIEGHYLFYMSTKIDENHNSELVNDRQKKIIATSIFLGFPNDVLASVQERMEREKYQPICKTSESDILNWALVDYIFSQWPNNAILIREFTDYYGLDENLIKQLIISEVLPINSCLLNFGINEPLITTRELDFMRIGRNFYYVEGADINTTLPDTACLINFLMALKVLNNDIELLLKSMITGQIRYIQKAPIKSVDNTLLFFRMSGVWLKKSKPDLKPTM